MLDYSMFIKDPISAIFLIIAVLWIAVPAIMKLTGKTVIVEEA